MKQLKNILYKVNLEKVIGSTSVPINEIHFDSRKVSLNDVFVAIVGTTVNGHQFITKAINQGAIAIICEQLPNTIVNGVTYIQVNNTQEALAYMAANYYDNPSQQLQLVGITGTNGKTTVASLLFQLFRKANYNTGLLSTVQIKINEEVFPATHTTPDSLTLNYYLSKMVNVGVTHCFMEVSSHGVHQKRTLGLTFKGGVFTNLTHDHLDYHQTFAAYRDVKKSFFDGLTAQSFSLVNEDDKNGAIMLQNTRARKYTYALKNHANFKTQILESQLSGMLLKIDQQEIWVKLIGLFNAYNVLAIYATATLLGMESLKVLQILSTLESVGGRFQYFVSPENITAIVDYAHTPDALKNVLQTINNIRTNNETLITVVGCGGNRDATKRPLMGEIAASLSNKVIFTNDNPRDEDPLQILKEIEQGVPALHYKKTLSIADREQAIKVACQMAQKGDIILIAGKGHETYQEIKGEKFPFNDFTIAKQLLT